MSKLWDLIGQTKRKKKDDELFPLLYINIKESYEKVICFYSQSVSLLKSYFSTRITTKVWIHINSQLIFMYKICTSSNGLWVGGSHFVYWIIFSG